MVKKSILLLTICMSHLVSANPDVTSREYKLMLDVSQFSFATASADVSDLLNDAENTVELAISRTVSGSPYLAKTRDVTFFDTPGSCELNKLGYSFRERVENGNSEVTLKFRSPDRYISDFEDVSASNNQSETKLEADVGYSATTAFKVVYGHSTTSPNTRNINELEDINDQFPGFDQDYGLSNNLALSKVGNLTVREYVYKGVSVDLGQFDADVSVTLWYQGVPSGNDTPLVAEISFKYKDNNGSYTRKVVNRAKVAFEALQDLTPWVDPASKTKTRFVYDFNSTFCQ